VDSSVTLTTSLVNWLFTFCWSPDILEQRGDCFAFAVDGAFRIREGCDLIMSLSLSATRRPVPPTMPRRRAESDRMQIRTRDIKILGHEDNT
jgi:hypothetical protein